MADTQKKGHCFVKSVHLIRYDSTPAGVNECGDERVAGWDKGLA